MADTVPSWYIDGANVGYGMQLVTFNGAGAGWIFEDFTVTRPEIVATDKQALGTPGRTRVTVDNITGSGTLQAPSGASGWPKFADYFTITVDDNYGAETFIINPPQYSATNDAAQLRKIPVTFRKKNASGAISVGPVLTPSA